MIKTELFIIAAPVLLSILHVLHERYQCADMDTSCFNSSCAMMSVMRVTMAPKTNDKEDLVVGKAALMDIFITDVTDTETYPLRYVKRDNSIIITVRDHSAATLNQYASSEFEGSVKHDLKAKIAVIIVFLLIGIMAVFAALTLKRQLDYQRTGRAASPRPIEDREKNSSVENIIHVNDILINDESEKKKMR